jgi:hypothetical protein
MDMGMKIKMDADAEVPIPPKRTDTVGQGQSIEAANAEAHERELRAEEATQRMNEEHQVAEVPPGLRDGEWEPQGEEA